MQVELEDIRAALKEEEERNESSYLDCFRPSNKILFRTLSGIFLQAWQQLTGINFIFYCKCLRLSLLSLSTDTSRGDPTQMARTSSRIPASRTPS